MQNPTVSYAFGACTPGSVGLTTGSLARLRLAKIRTMTMPNSPDTLLKRAMEEKLRLNVLTSVRFQEDFPRRHE